MAKILTIFILFLFSSLNLRAQKNNYSIFLGSSAGYTSPGKMPFWLRSNKFGNIPLDNSSLSLTGSIRKDYETSGKKLFDWGVSFEGCTNIGQESNFNIIEGNGKIRIGVFEIMAGRSKEIMGLCDTSLTSGSWAVSGNAPGIPKLQFGIPQFYSLPVFGRMFALKGNYVHGYIGMTTRKKNGILLNRETETYLHQKSLYGRFGKPEWKWKFYGGFNHQVFWGSEKQYFGEIYTLSPSKTYLYVITGKGYGSTSTPFSRIGNHLGSIDLGFEIELQNTRLLAYRQNIYDAGALAHLANIRDGLNGLSLINTVHSNKGFRWKKMLIEVLFTKNQAGEFWSPLTASGDEEYYNNSVYVQGWSYKNLVIGNPFISTREYTRRGLPADPNDYFINNRVVAFHFGCEGSVKKWDFILKTSHSLNYGTFGTSEVGHTMGTARTPPGYGIFREKQQFSGYVELNRKLNQSLNFGFTGAFDAGELYYDSFGILFRISKTFNL